MSFRTFSLLLIILLTSGCAAIINAPIPIVPQAPVLQPLNASNADFLRPMALDRVIFYMEENSVIGEDRQGTMCILPKPKIWNKSEPEIWVRGLYHKEFKTVLKENGYIYPETPADSLFSEYKPTGQELIVRAKISDINENYCFARNFLKTYPNNAMYKGSVRFVVYWEIYSLLENKVVYRAKTLGSAKGENFKSPKEHQYYKKAFGNALKNLLADKKLLSILTQKTETDNKIAI